MAINLTMLTVNSVNNLIYLKAQIVYVTILQFNNLWLMRDTVEIILIVIHLIIFNF